MNFCIYNTLEEAQDNLNIINNAYILTVIETCNGITLNNKITQKWSEVTQYQEGYGFLAPKQEFLDLISGYLLLENVSFMPIENQMPIIS